MPPENRKHSGRKPGTFEPGKSGNPGGRPKDVGPIKELAKQHTLPAMQALVSALKDKNGRTRVAAAEAILDRGYGKPTQHHEIDAGDELAKALDLAWKRANGGGSGKA
jgi:hypothetical protein